MGREGQGPRAQLGTECVVELIRTAGALEGVLDDLFRRHGLTGPGFNVLTILEGAGEPLSPGVIGERRLVTRGTVTGLLDTLESRGLVRRHPHPQDRRMLSVELTDDARVVLESVGRELFPLQEALTSVMTTGEKTTLLRLVRKLRSAVAAHEA